MTIAQALRLALRLARVSDTPRLDAELLLAAASGLTRTFLYTWPERELTAQAQTQYQHMLARRETGEPIAHITGQREFWSLNLQVDASTLIPRPDTEVLVETVLAHITTPNPRIIDLGTGTGAIALALASELPQAQITAIDASAAAVALAQKNATALGLTQVLVAQGSWLDARWCQTLCLQPAFDVMVSNPPYIDDQDPHLQQGDVRFEPRTALVASAQGLGDIQAIAQLASQALKPEGYLWLEHGWQQANAVAKVLSGAGFKHIQTRNDYGGNPRVTGGQRQ